MVNRGDMGSWLEGAPRHNRPGHGPGSPDASDGPSGRGPGLGLPPSGPGSLAPIGRRVVAILIDWALCSLIAAAFFRGQTLMPVVVLAAENVLLVGALGTTIGHRLLGLVVRTPSGGPAGIGRAALRTALLCLVIPAVVWDADGRGMHDRAAGTVVLRS